MSLDPVSSLIHLKLKYHVHGELAMINIDLLEEKWIYQTLEQYQKEGDAKEMDINVASLIGKLKGMVIQSPPSKASHPKRTNEYG